MPQPDKITVARLADGLVVLVGLLVETRPAGDFKRSTAEAAVAGHEGSFTVHEARDLSALEGVVDELGSVSHCELDGLVPAANGVVREDVVLRSPRICHPRVVRPLVRVDVVPEEGEIERCLRTGCT